MHLDIRLYFKIILTICRSSKPPIPCIESHVVKLLALLSSQGNYFDNLILNKEVLTLAVVQKRTYVTYLTNHIVAIMNSCINANVSFVSMISFVSFVKVS